MLTFTDFEKWCYVNRMKLEDIGFNFSQHVIHSKQSMEVSVYGNDVIQFVSNDYNSFSSNPEVIRAIISRLSK